MKSHAHALASGLPCHPSGHRSKEGRFAQVDGLQQALEERSNTIYIFGSSRCRFSPG